MTSPAYRALLAERYGRSIWFSSHPDNTDGPTARLMMADEFDDIHRQSTGTCGQATREDGEECVDGVTMGEGQSRVNGASPLGTTSTHPKGT